MTIQSIYRKLWLAVIVLGLVNTLMPLSAQQARRLERFEVYIRSYHAEAERQMKRYNIPASITLAQGLLETGGGTSTLASVHNNHFGIKCHSSWQGARAFRTDDRPNECFRSYARWQDSYEDHSKFLLAARYRRLFSLPADDYRGWARGLQTAGYATDKGYANKLIKIIEDYELYTLDRGERPSWIAGSTTRERQQASSRVRPSAPPKAKSALEIRPIYKSYGLYYVLASHGETYESISAELGVSARKLARYNDAPRDFTLQEGDIVYLESKNSRAPREYRTHTVRVGESMHSISQRYGIKLAKLYQRNEKDEDYVPEEGDILRLR